MLGRRERKEFNQLSCSLCLVRGICVHLRGSATPQKRGAELTMPQSLMVSVYEKGHPVYYRELCRTRCVEVLQQFGGGEAAR
jgi:hypothetical protein